jgi:anaerobic magnesium-protoporphyrin IX monomethyl ester cyclase
MKITLIVPDSDFLDDNRAFPNLGVLYLSSSLKKHGFDVDIFDMTLDKDLSKVKTDIVGISATSPNVETAVKIAYKLKSRGCRFVILGGCGAGSASKYKHVFDFILKGECEDKIVDFMNAVKNNDYEALSIIRNKVDVPDINNIEYPDRSDLKDYNYKIDGRKTATMITSRGCCFSCAFCEEGKTRNLRVRNIDNVLGEIDEISELSYKAVMIFDDIFTSNTKRLKRIANHLKSKDIYYRCFTHVKFAKKSAKILAETNCKEVGIGIESGDDNILQTINKGFTSNQANEAIKILKDHGLRVKVFLMLGLPGETMKTIENTKKWYEKAGPDLFNLSIYTPFSGTHIYENKDKYDIDWDDVTPTNFYESTVWTDSVDKKTLLKEKNKFYEQYG